MPTEIKKMTWTEITAQVNEIGECHREVMEVVKKWSDLKCDTKRKVAAMQSGNMLSRGFNSRISRDLNHTERLVLQILEMDDDDKGMSEYGPLVDDDDGAEIEEEVEEDTMEQQNSPNGDMGSMPPPTSVTTRKQSGSNYYKFHLTMVLTRVVLIHLFLQTNTSIQLRHQVPTPIPFTCLVSINGNIKVTKICGKYSDMQYACI